MRASFIHCLLASMLMWPVAWLHAQTPEQHIRAQLGLLQPDLAIEHINLVSGSSLYQVQVGGGQFLYVDDKAEFILHGQLYQVQSGSAVNLTEQAQQGVTAQLIQGLRTEDMVIFPAVERKASITVFTDVDCGYCQKLHGEVPALNEGGIEVRYLAWPRQGLSGGTYDTMVGIWCSGERQDAMTRAKRRQPVAKATCKHPVDRQFALGQQIGVRGTPAIVLANGELIPGYMPAAQLIARALQAQQ